MLTMRNFFVVFQNMLIVKYILSFKDKPDLLKKPPSNYNFIDEEY